MSERIMIVEDSPPIRRSLVKLLEKIDEDKHFDIVDASNGLDAITKIRENNIDILITDIQMPVMGGLELLRLVNEEFPECERIILSSYQEFEYAQEAIKQGVSEYLIKPVTEDTLRKVISASLDKVQKKKATSVNDSWDRYVRGTSSLPPVESVDKKYISALIIAGSFPNIPDAGRSRASEAFGFSKYREQIQNLQKNSDSKFRAVPGLYSSEYIYSIEDKDNAEEKLKSLYRTICEQDIPITMIIDDTAFAVEEIGKRIFILRKTCYENKIFARSSLIKISDVNSDKQSLNDYEDRIQSIARAYEAGSIKVIGDRIHELLQLVEAEGISEFDLSELIEKIVLRCVETDKSVKYREATLRYEADIIISSSLSYEELYQNLCLLINRYLENKNTEDVKGDAPAFVRKVEEYIRTNYAEPINNQKLADEFGFVPSYISKLFSMYLDTSPKKYLISVRIEKAKEILDSNNDIKVNEVSQLVGFNDAQYFSKVFHEHTGIWPSEYKSAK